MTLARGEPAAGGGPVLTAIFPHVVSAQSCETNSTQLRFQSIDSVLLELLLAHLQRHPGARRKLPVTAACCPTWDCPRLDTVTEFQRKINQTTYAPNDIALASRDPASLKEWLLELCPPDPLLLGKVGRGHGPTSYPAKAAPATCLGLQPPAAATLVNHDGCWGTWRQLCKS